MSRVRFLLRQLYYDADRGLLVRPALIVAVFVAIAVALPHAEETVAPLGALGHSLTWAVPSEPGAVQLVLATIAGGVMTVVSIVYSVLVVAMSLASVQYSPRVLVGFLSDRTCQRVLGLFIGTFTYCLLVLRSARGAPEPFVPTVSAFLALVFALSCLGSLLFFVHHMTQAMQANYIVDNIAAETEVIMEGLLPVKPSKPVEVPARPEEKANNVVRSKASGYVQLIAVEELADLAKSKGITLHLVRATGQFVPEHGMLVVADGTLDAATQNEIFKAFDIGPVRTMQDDIELGLRQIVDIALKAISPAVNDPSTAVTCIDHLCRLLGKAARRSDADVVRSDKATGKVHLVMPPAGFGRLLDLAINQIRQYGKGDVAVLLRIIRTLADVADISNHPSHLVEVRRHAAMIQRASEALHADDRQEVDVRLGVLNGRLDAKQGRAEKAA